MHICIYHTVHISNHLHKICPPTRILSLSLSHGPSLYHHLSLHPPPLHLILPPILPLLTCPNFLISSSRCPSAFRLASVVFKSPNLFLLPRSPFPPPIFPLNTVQIFGRFGHPPSALPCSPSSHLSLQWLTMLCKVCTTNWQIPPLTDAN